MRKTRETSTDEIVGTIVASVQTDPGCIREANEDSGRHIIPNDAGIREKMGTLTIVADGMGGHASGEVASRMAVDLISEFYYADDSMSAPVALKEAVELANLSIYQASSTEEKYFGMGTTVVALVIQGNTAFSAHVGDSRLYRMRGGELELLTCDHSQVMEMVKHGIISMNEARNHDDKNVILRAVGTQSTVEVEVSPTFAIEIGDTFLLCSDGLSDMVEDAGIEAILAANQDIHVACERLIDEAKANGGHDNITAGVIRINAEDLAESYQNVRVTREVEALD
jgi:serine/threonine protein phosphatase PrpC